MTTNHEPKPEPLTDDEIENHRGILAHECTEFCAVAHDHYFRRRVIATIDRLRAERDDAVKREESQAIEIDRLGLIYCDMRDKKDQTIATLQRQIEAAKEGVGSCGHKRNYSIDGVVQGKCYHCSGASDSSVDETRHYRAVSKSGLMAHCVSLNSDSSASAPVVPPVTESPEVAELPHRHALWAALRAYQTALHEHCEDSIEPEKLAIAAYHKAIKRVRLEINEGRQPLRFGGD